MKKVWTNFDSLDEAFGMEPRGGGQWIEYDESQLPGTHPYGDLISEALKGRVFSEEWRKKLSDKAKRPSGRKMSEEQKKKMSEARWKGHKKMTKEEHRTWMREYQREKYKSLKTINNKKRDTNAKLQRDIREQSSKEEEQRSIHP